MPGLTHALGLRRSLKLCWGAILLAQALTLALAPGWLAGALT